MQNFWSFDSTCSNLGLHDSPPRKKFHKARSWRKFSAAERAQLKSGVLASLVAEQEQGVRAALVQLVGSLARHELEAGSGGWPELMELIQHRVVSQAWTCWRSSSKKSR